MQSLYRLSDLPEYEEKHRTPLIQLILNKKKIFDNVNRYFYITPMKLTIDQARMPVKHFF